MAPKKKYMIKNIDSNVEIVQPMMGIGGVKNYKPLHEQVER